MPPDYPEYEAKITIRGPNASTVYLKLIDEFGALGWEFGVFEPGEGTYIIYVNMIY